MSKKNPARISVWEPTPKRIIDEVLHFAQIKPSDVFFDLGSGNGCVLVRASELYGCKSVGLEISQKLIQATMQKAKHRGMGSLVSVRNQDMRKAEYQRAKVVYMYLPDKAVHRMFPILLEKCQPGTKIVTLGSKYVTGNYEALTPFKEMHMQMPKRFWKLRMWKVG